MVDERKVRLMTKLSIYEKHEKNKDLVVSRYFRGDFVRFNVLKTWIFVTIAYWTVVAAFVFVGFDEVLAQLNNIDYFDVMYKYLGYYAALCIILCVISGFVYKYRYAKAKPRLTRYNSMLKDLIELQGGPARRGKLVKNSRISMENPRISNQTHAGDAQGNNQRSRVNRSEILKQRIEQEKRAKEQQIIENVRQRNERIAAKNREELRKRQEYESQMQRRRQQERAQLERMQRIQTGKTQPERTYSDRKENR